MIKPAKFHWGCNWAELGNIEESGLAWDLLIDSIYPKKSPNAEIWIELSALRKLGKIWGWKQGNWTFFSLNKARDSSQNFDSLKEETKEEQSKLKKKVSQVRIDRFNTILGSEQQFFFVRVDISILPPFGVIFEMIFGLE